MDPAERLARRFNEICRRLAPQHGYEFSGPDVKIREDRSLPFDLLPSNNRELLIAIFREMLKDPALGCPDARP